MSWYGKYYHYLEQGSNVLASKLFSASKELVESDLFMHKFRVLECRDLVPWNWNKCLIIEGAHTAYCTLQTAQCTLYITQSQKATQHFAHWALSLYEVYRHVLKYFQFPGLSKNNWWLKIHLNIFMVKILSVFFFFSFSLQLMSTILLASSLSYAVSLCLDTLTVLYSYH